MSEPELPGVRAPTEVVVLVHGLMRTTRSLSSLGDRLVSEGYRVRTYDYPSLRDSIQDHGNGLRAFLVEVADEGGVTAVHLVTHSMGGLVTRAALGTTPPPKVHRVVMLAPPNQGSSLARRLQPLLGGLLAPLAELSDHEDSTARNLPVPDGVEVGVIAASLDHAVPDGSTHLAGERDHMEVTGLHSMLMYQRPVLDQVVAFLRGGRFQRDTTEDSR